MAMRKEEEADVMPSFAFGAGPDAGDEEEDYRQQAQGISGGLPAAPRYTDTDLRALALEHAVATRTAEDKSSGTSVVDRADKFLKFLRGDT